MYEICVAIQYVGIIITMLGLMYLLQQWPSRPQSFMLFLELAMLVNGVGYLFEITATTLEAALTATKLSYVGKVYIPPLALFFVLDYCRIKVSKSFVGLLTVVHTAVLVIVMTCEHHELFYSDIEFARNGLFPHLVSGYGVIYVLYMTLILCYAVLMLGVCLYRYRRSEREERNKIAYLSMIVLLPVLGLVLYLSGVTMGYDATAVSYIWSGIILMVSIFRYDFFDTVNLAKNYVAENLADGLVVLGKQGQFVYANALALRLFPQLNEKEYTVAVEEIRKYCVKGKMMHVDSNVYKVTERDIFQNRTLRGKMYYLQDVTDSHNYTMKLETEVRDKALELFQSHHSLIVSLANMVEARDGVTGLHIKHTSEYVGIIARALQKVPKYQAVMSNSYVSVLSEAAPLHDIGKISMEDAILRKEGSLTTEELKSIHSHPALGAQIIDGVLAEVKNSEYLLTAREMAYSHHEKWDGSGYPQGLKGEEIPLSARIMALADVYDALRSERSYKEAYSKEEAKRIMLEEAGRQFDPELVEVFLENLEEIEAVK